MKGLRFIFITCLVLIGTETYSANIGNNNTRSQTARRNTSAQRANTSTNKQHTKIITRTDGQNNIRTRTGTNLQKTPRKTPPQQAKITSRTAINTNRSTPQKLTTRINSAHNQQNGRITRTATNTETKNTNSILNNNYKTCREVYNNCMDEFCANKDSQLKRCACSTRSSDFIKIQSRLDTVEDKLLDFNQKLLTVNMDAEDAAAINIATDGEKAYNTTDTSESKKLLNKISDQLNKKFNSSDTGTNMSALSFSIDADSAFDNFDSLSAASTTLKSGRDLYNAALPICQEMANEVCDAEALNIAQNSYQMLIEQDCNTVAKAYTAKQTAAREKILEGSALLDMSRLDIHQQRNSDDILTCRQKMLDMLTNSTVCGTNLSKCLDITGHYINPSTGEVFLTTDLYKLNSLITRPTNGQKWANTANNKTFVTFLESKKTYIEPAIENCQNTANDIWDDFIEDALGQIKLAQTNKLEEIRQSCTSLLSECLDSAKTSITEFDSRALSIFGVLADKTVNEMCSNVKKSCSSITSLNLDSTETWDSGVAEITNDTTYNTILTTCREIGRSCIIQTCTSVNGNFGLCEDILTSINRKAIIYRTACWNEVQSCVQDAITQSPTPIQEIMTQLKKYHDGTNGTTRGYDNFYSDLYNNINQVDNICSVCNSNSTDINCGICRIAERIWGNCTESPNNNSQTNSILIPKTSSTDTLLAWFAQNTNTIGTGSCRSLGTCADGYRMYNGSCISTNSFIAGEYCPNQTQQNYSFTPTQSITNCCGSGLTDSNGNCCAETNHTIKNGTTILCTPHNISEVTEIGTNNNDTVYCYGTVTTPNNTTLECDGVLITVDNNGYYKPTLSSSTYQITQSYKASETQTCSYNGTNSNWDDCTIPDYWKVSLQNIN